MSREKDMLRLVIQAAMNVPLYYLDTLADVASKLAKDNLENDDWKRRLDWLLRDVPCANPGIVLTSVFYLSVDYRKSFEEMKVAGRYSQEHRFHPEKDSVTTERFPIKEVRKDMVWFEARYFKPSEKGFSEDVRRIELADIENPWMPAKIEHIFSLGATFPNEQGQYTIVGLGSVTEIRDDYNVVPGLDKNDDYERSIFSYRWNRTKGNRLFSRILAVREIKPRF